MKTGLRMIGLDDVLAAREAIGNRLHHTPTFSSAQLSELTGANVLLKAELFQRTVQQRSDLLPGFRLRFASARQVVLGLVNLRLHECLLFAALPPPLTRQRIGARIARCAAKPAA